MASALAQLPDLRRIVVLSTYSLAPESPIVVASGKASRIAGVQEVPRTHNVAHVALSIKRSLKLQSVVCPCTCLAGDVPETFKMPSATGDLEKYPGDV